MPYWRISSFYLVYFASLGVILPYWALYLRDLGFSPLAIGELMALPMLTKVLSPGLWGWLADHLGHRMMVVRIGALLAVVAFAGMFLVEGYLGIALVMFTFTFFWNAVLSPLEAVSLAHFRGDPHLYSRARLWGSIGFILAVAGLGLLLDRTGTAPLPMVLFSLFGLIFIASLIVPEPCPDPHVGDHAPISHIVRRPEVIALVVCALLMQASHGPYYTFYTIYMEGVGYSRTVVGGLWALGVIAEVGIFLIIGRLLHHFGMRQLLLLAYVLALIRWVLTGALPDVVPVVLLAQLLHAATFGLHHAAAIALIHRHFRGRHHGKGQGIYAGLGLGLGGALGSWYSGLVWQELGASAAFMTAALFPIVAFLIAYRWVHPERKIGTG